MHKSSNLWPVSMGKLLKLNFLTKNFGWSKGGTLGIFWKNGKKKFQFFFQKWFLINYLQLQFVFKQFLEKKNLKNFFITFQNIPRGPPLDQPKFLVTNFNFNNFPILTGPKYEDLCKKFIPYYSKRGSVFFLRHPVWSTSKKIPSYYYQN